MIVGSKGGKGGGGASYRAPVEAPNTLQSTQWVTIVDAVSEGPIVGLIDDAKGIALNYTPLETETGTKTYRDVSYQVLNGLPDQQPLNGIDGVEAEQTVGVEITNLFPKGIGPERGSLSRQISNTNCTDVRITLQVNGLYFQVSKDGSRAGDIDPTEISYRIMITNKRDEVIVDYTKTMKDKTMSTAQWSEEFSLDKNGPWTVTVYKETEDSNQANLHNDLYWASYTEIVGYKMMYPNTAVVAIRGSAEAFGSSVPNRNYHVKGLKIEVPTNYNPETREYSGVWNGNFKLAWTDNPAWVFRDIIENDRYGVRKFFSPDQINDTLVDKWSLYEIAQYCDELVPDGNGGTEPRYTFNGVISGAGEAVKVVQSIASTFCGMSFWSSGIVFATADRLQDPIKTISQVNTIGGKITYATASNQERHSVCRVTWYDPDDYSRARIESVYDWELYKQVGERPIQKVAYGCTSRGQAYRFGLWTLLTEKEQWTATAEVGLDCYDLLPNDWVSVADPILMGVRYSGRIKSISGKTVVLDSPVDLKENETYTITIIAEDNTEMVRTITSRGNSDTITLQSSLNKSTVDNAIWSIAGTDAAPRIFSIQTITKNDDNTGFVLSMKEVDPNKYHQLDNDYKLDPVPNRRIARGVITAPRNLNIVENSYAANGSIFNMLTFSWENGSQEAATFEPVYILPNGDTVRLAEQKHYTVQVPQAVAGQYTFKVRAKSADGRVSEFAEKLFNATGSNVEPSEPTNFTATGAYRSANLSWTMPNDPYIGYFEIYMLKVTGDPSFDEDVANATLIAKLYGSSFTITGAMDDSQLYYFWIRSVNVNGGVVSNWVGPAAAMTDPMIVPDIPDGLITRPKLDDVLNQHIDVTNILTNHEANNNVLNAVDTFNERIENDSGFAEVKQQIKTEIDEVNGAVAVMNTRLQSNIDNANALINENRQTIAKNDYAMAKRVDTIASSVGNNTAAIQSTSSALATLNGECEAQYTLRTDVNGRISGFGLWNSGTASEFTIRADKFYICPSSAGAGTQVFAIDSSTGNVLINGNLFVNSANKAGTGWIVGDMISASSVITLNNGSIVIDGTNGTIKVLDPANKTSGTYTTITNGYVNQYVDGRLARSLTGVETGECTNGTWKNLTGKYTNQPYIIITPKSLQSFNASNSTANQSINCHVQSIESTGNNTWRFKPAATLNSSSIQDGISVPSRKYDINGIIHYTASNTCPRTITTDSVTTGTGCTRITVSATLHGIIVSSIYNNRWTIYDGSLKFRIKYKLTSASSWSYSSYCTAKTCTYQESYTNTISQNVSSGNYNVAVEFYLTYTGSTKNIYIPDNSDFELYQTYIDVDSIICNRGSTSNLATGTLNYIAIGR